jgi:hypothetical protein
VEPARVVRVTGALVPLLQVPVYVHGVLSVLAYLIPQLLLAPLDLAKIHGFREGGPFEPDPL